jgi:NAD(P)-dependent dehydrogenase (short-subunit alcohol dehydrogenase family)
MSKTIVITGASDGIGAQAARTLSANGHNVVIVGRSPQKTKAVAAETGSDYYTADFTDLAQVRELAHILKASYPQIDVLANNAGGVFRDTKRTVDGHEQTLQVNHLAPFLLTNLLLDTLIESRASVIQTASSVAKRIGHLDIDNLDRDDAYTPIKAYSNAKLANILFTKELHRRYAAQGIAAVAFHPGNVASNFASDTTGSWRLIYNTPLRHIMLISPRKGAEPLIWLAEGEPGRDWQPGEYYEKHRIATTNPQASDAVLADELWQRSAEMVGLTATPNSRVTT